MAYFIVSLSMRSLIMPLLFIVLVALITQIELSAQDDSSAASQVDKLRTESGVDPTRVASRLSYSFIILDQTGPTVDILNQARFTLGVDRWSFSLKQALTARGTGEPGAGFLTGASDLSFTILNAFIVTSKHALAASAEVIFPTGSTGISNNYMTVTPQMTYSYTISPQLIFATQPQYTFDMYRDPLYPAVSVLTIRSFLATFLSSGWFFVLEPRPIYDFTNDQFNLIISPIAGTSLGGGFTLTVLFEFPTRSEAYQTRGMWSQLGVAKNL
jgi:hypothetical protein